MKDECIVSVLCATYNHEKYIRQTLESFLAQKTDFSIEILVHEDASTDATADIVREMAAAHPDMIFPVIQTENQFSKGVVVLDILTRKARGKYIALCEGDDYWSDPCKLQRQVDWLESHPEYSACVHNSTTLNCETGTQIPYNPVETTDRDYDLNDVIAGIGKLYHTSSVLVRKTLMTQMPDFYYISMRHHVGDQPMAIWFAINGKIRFLRESMSVYRQFSAPSSWSVRVREAAYVEGRLVGGIEMFKSVMKYADGLGRQIVCDCILKYEWELLQARGEYEQMKKAPYDKLFKAAPLKQRLWINFKLHCPWVFMVLMKLRGREDGIPERLRRK